MGIDKGNSNAAVIQFDSTYGVHYPSVSGTQGNGNAVHWDYNIQATPTVVVIKPDRSIAIKQIFPPSTSNVVDSITQAGGVQQECLTAIDKINANEVKLYPNPVQSYLSVELNPAFDLKSMTIYDLTGSSVGNLEIIGESGNKWIISTQNLPAGFYFVEVRTNKGEAALRKFIKH